MKTNAETRKHLQNLINMIENQFNCHLKILRSDNGPEFLMTDFFNRKGIVHQTSCVETPQQNSIVERKHQHILNVARALIFQSHLPLCFLSYAVKHFVH